jgi:hypothetical protein
MFTPCLNISMAARQIAELVDRCKAVPPIKPDPVHCAIAAYRGSWNHPDNKFADAVQTSMVKGDAPNFDMADEAYDGSADVGPQAPVAGHYASTTSPVTRDDQLQGWSSALFPARSQHFGRVSASTNSNGPDADRLQESNVFTAHPMTPGFRDDDLFVRRLPGRRPQ